MSYATLQDLIDRFGQDEIRLVSDRAEPPAGEIDQDVVARALADASQLIDGYLGSRYTLPIEEVPALLGQLACDIARYLLHDDMPTDAVTQRYKDAIAHLGRIAAGTVVLQVQGIASPETNSEVLYDAPGRIFDRQTLEGF
jgi:phage gp36-like protein